MKKLLLITYYWPPSGGAGVQRCLKMAKYYRDFGWEPIIYTAENAAYPIVDESLLEDVMPDQQVLRGPIWEPYELYKRFTGKKKGEKVFSGFLSEDRKPSFTQKASIWIRGNFFIPDARKFWIKPSIKYLKKYLSENPVDAIISSGPPHSVHMIAKGIKDATGLPWVADFRDPWTNIDFYDQLMLTPWADRQHRKMEKAVLETCDHVTTVGWTLADELKALGAPGVTVITNGFDHADFPENRPDPAPEFSFNHIGYLNKDRNSPLLWKAFGELCDEIPDMRETLKLRFIGKTDFVVFNDLEKNGLSDLVEKIDYLPHSEIVDVLHQAQILLLLLNDTPNAEGILPGKAFEYLAARRPVLTIGPETGDLARILTKTEVGPICSFGNFEKMKKEIFKLYQRFKKGNMHVPEVDISLYTRKGASGQMVKILEELIPNNSK